MCPAENSIDSIRNQKCFWEKIYRFFFKLKTLHAIVCRRHRWIFTVINKERLNLQLWFVLIMGVTTCLRLDSFVSIVLIGGQGLQMSLWSEQIYFFLARGRAIISYSSEKNEQKKIFPDSNAFNIASNQTQVRSNPPLIRSFGPKWPMVRTSSSKWLVISNSTDRRRVRNNVLSVDVSKEVLLHMGSDDTNAKDF